MKVKIDRPLDWLAITDHAEYMGISDQIRAGSPDLLANPQGKRWYEMSKTSPQEGVKAAIEAVVSMQTGKPVFDASKLTAGAWTHAIASAEKWNQPGVFTTLHGFEWTSAPGGNNLHRTVIFRDNADRVNQVVPYSTFDSQDPADLWKYMDAYATKTGGQVLAIPHNGNLSNGIMYTAETFDGKPMTGTTPRHAPATSLCWRRRRLRVMVRLIPSSRRTTNSPTSSAGTSTSTRWCRRKTACSMPTMSARRSNWDWNWKQSLAPIRTRPA